MLADLLKASTRKEDLVGRYGGEEFCLVLPGMSVEQACSVAERIRLRIKDESSKRYENGPRVTASIGVASMLDNPADPGALNILADEALYCAKENGRNRVVSYPSIGEIEDKPSELLALVEEGHPPVVGPQIERSRICSIASPSWKISQRNFRPSSNITRAMTTLPACQTRRCFTIVSTRESSVAVAMMSFPRC